MTDDLVKRLRRSDTCIFPTERDRCHCGEAADRILKLEAALIDILKVPRSEASWGIALVIAHHALNAE